MGGIRITKRECVTCARVFDSMGGTKKCKECRYRNICNHCNIEFISNGERHRTYCDECVTGQIWKSGPRPKHVGKQISESKKAWYKTEEGKLHVKKMKSIMPDKIKSYNKTPAGKVMREKVAKKLSGIIKERIATGIFTPKITNTRTHWDAKIILETGNVKRFRSSWEAVFWNCNQYLEYETVRIPWVDDNKESHSYIADFFDREKNILYEIKPRSTWPTQQEKMQQVIKYCLHNKIKFVWINEQNIFDYIDESQFINSENLKQLQKVKNGIKKDTNYIDSKDGKKGSRI